MTVECWSYFREGKQTSYFPYMRVMIKLSAVKWLCSMVWNFQTMYIWRELKLEEQGKNKNCLTRISWPIQAKEIERKTAQTTANAMQKGETASVRYETAPKKGTLTNDSPAGWNHLKLYLLGVSCTFYTSFEKRWNLTSVVKDKNGRINNKRTQVMLPNEDNIILIL